VPDSFFVLGDQLSTDVAPWSTLPRDTVIVMIESARLVEAPRHRTRTGLYVCAMRAFARHVQSLGFTVDYRRAESFSTGIAEHRLLFQPGRICMNHPRGRRATALFTSLDIELLDSPFYLTPIATFREDVAGRKAPTMEQFYRKQRRRLNVLMLGAEPVGGRWNFDEENRKPLPKDGGSWPEPWQAALTPDEEVVMVDLAATHPGSDALVYWPRTRAQALDQLRDAMERIVPTFGPFEDAASVANWHLAHSRLSAALNLGLLHPSEVLSATVAAFEAGRIPLASAEGFVRQIIGWREWVWGWHHLRSEEFRLVNALEARTPLPQTWRNFGPHEMNCLASALGHLRDFGWNHHIERLMMLANAATLAGIAPLELNDWMAQNYVDGAEWVMEVNVLGMGTFADGGQTSTKPYIAGGNYINKMTDCCRGCRYQPTERVGERACPLTNAYWNFLLEDQPALTTNVRIAPQRRAATQRPDREAIRNQAKLAREQITG
jgi:deoxyribodipyrimidine photolyase-related protein